jgi:hypothetical protein
MPTEQTCVCREEHAHRTRGGQRTTRAGFLERNCRIVIWQAAVRCGLLAFAATVLTGSVAGLSLSQGVWQGVFRLAVFYGLGLVGGELARRLADEVAERDFAAWRQIADNKTA